MVIPLLYSSEHPQSEDMFSRQRQVLGLVSLRVGQWPRYHSRYGPGPCKSTPALGTFFEFDVRLWVSSTMLAEEERSLCRCREPLPGAGLDPPPASQALPVVGLLANGPAGSKCRERAEDALTCLVFYKMWVN